MSESSTNSGLTCCDELVEVYLFFAWSMPLIITVIYLFGSVLALFRYTFFSDLLYEVNFV